MRGKNKSLEQRRMQQKLLVYSARNLQQDETQPIPAIANQLPTYISSLSAGFHQGDVSLFGAAAGKQCTCIATVFLLQSFVDPHMELWDSPTLQAIMEDGTVLYTHLTRNSPITYLLINELPNTIELRDQTFQITKHNPYNGLVNTEATDGPFYNLDDALLQALTEHNRVYLTLGHNRHNQQGSQEASYTSALLRHSNGTFIAFDSHARNEHGALSFDGKCVLITFQDIQGVQVYVRHLANSLNLHDGMFEIVPITLQNLQVIDYQTNSTQNEDMLRRYFTYQQHRQQMHGTPTTTRKQTQQQPAKSTPEVKKSAKHAKRCRSDPDATKRKAERERTLRSDPVVKQQRAQREKAQRSDPLVKLKRAERRKTQNLNPLVKQMRAQREKAQRSEPLVKQKRAQREKEQRSEPLVKQKRGEREKDQRSEPLVKQKRGEREKDQRSEPLVKQKRGEREKDQRSEPLVKQKRGEREKDQRSEPLVKQKRGEREKDQRSEPLVKQKRGEREKDQRSEPLVKQKRGEREKDQRSEPLVKQKRAQREKEQRSEPLVKQKRGEREQDQRSEPLVKQKRAQREKDQRSEPLVKQKRAQRESFQRSDPQVQQKRADREKNQRSHPDSKKLRQSRESQQRQDPHIQLLRQQREAVQRSEPQTDILRKDRERSYRQHPAVKAKKSDKEKTLYKEREFREKKITASSQKKKKDKEQTQDIDFVLQQFKNLCTEKPIHVCIVCHRYMFMKQVLKYDKSKYSKCTSDCKNLLENSVGLRTSEKLWVCRYCHSYLKKSKIPPIAWSNNLLPAEMPPDLQHLNSLEQHLVTPVIPFMKIVALPKGSQQGIHGPVVCVAADIQRTATSLPKPINSSSLIKVKLKRKLQYKGHHLYQQISPSKIAEALHYLKANHPAYKDIDINQAALDQTISDESSINQQHDHSTEENNHETISQDDVDQLPDLLEDSLPPDIEQRNLHHNSETRDTNTSQEAPGCSTTSSTDETTNNPDQTADDLPETTAPLVTCMQPTDLSQHLSDNHEEIIFNVAPGEGKIPSSIFQKEATAFPTLFPDGRNSYDSTREHKLGFSQYIKSRLFSENQIYASNPTYIFYLQYLKEMKEVMQSAQISLRKTTSTTTADKGPITASHLNNANNIRKVLRSNEGYKFLKSVRGSAPFWQKKTRELCAIVKQLGIPTWFASFSAADRRWTEIAESILRQQNKDVPSNMDWSEHCQVIKSNPVTAALMFNNRANHFINSVILSHAHPVGHVVDYFYRIEFQQRGWPHIHALFWVKDAPTYDEKDETTYQTVADFVEKFVHCKMPEPENPLFQIVPEVQMHSKRHSKTCKKGNKKCRFNFPKPPSLRTFICVPLPCPEDATMSEWKENAQKILARLWNILDDAEAENMTTEELFEKALITQESLEHSMCVLATRTIIIMKRTPKECWINQYNRHLLQAWNANMDIQFVLDVWSCIKYILSYISKKESEEGELLKAAQQEGREGNLDAVSELRTLGKVYLTHREVSIMEAIYRATGMKLCQATRQVTWIPTDPTANRLSLPLKTISTLDKNSENIWATSLLDRYLSRPNMDIFEDISLATFASEYRLISSHSRQDEEEEEKEGDDLEGQNEEAPLNPSYNLQNNLGSIKKRTQGKEAVIRYPTFSKEKDPERFYMNLLRLYLPHRTSTLKPDNYLTFEHYFNDGEIMFRGSITPVSTVVDHSKQKFDKLSQKVDEAYEDLLNNPNQPDAWAEIAPQAEEERIELENDNHETVEIEEGDFPDMDTISASTSGSSSLAPSTEAFRLTISKEVALPLIRTLNNQQYELFQHITNWCHQKVTGGRPQPLSIFLSGGAGTGKSHFIRALYYEANRILSSLCDSPDQVTVLLVAYTGTAAFNIQGQTIHSAFAITNPAREYIPLSEEKLSNLRTKYEHLQLLIIDEISMVDKRLFNYISGRLDQIKRSSNKDSMFGNISVLAVGDFFQIPPVKGESLLKEDSGSLIDFWPRFQHWTLNTIMRQKDDKPFAEMLNRLRVRDKRTQIPQEDIQVLKSRIISSDHPAYPSSAIHVFAKRISVADHNKAMILSLPDVITITAADIVTSTDGKTKKRKNPAQTTNALLETSVTIAVDARVMLTVNVNVKDGLVNGVMGTVTAILQNKNKFGQPQVIFVKFDNKAVGLEQRRKLPQLPNTDDQSTPIMPHHEKVIRENLTRVQYPLRLAWACTIHKTQGMTLSSAVISLEGIFRDGMGYVALSRVTSLKGLYLLNMDEKKIYASKTTKLALEKMEQLILQPSVAPLLHLHTQNFTVVFHNVQSLPAHYLDVANNPEMTRAHVIALSESCLTNHNRTENFTLPGYTLLRCDRYRGGVAMYLRESLQYRILSLPTSTFDALAVTIQTPPLQIYLIYKQPAVSKRLFNSQLQQFDFPQGIPVLVGGDFNDNIMNNPSASPYQVLSTFQQLINKPTTSALTLLDHIYVKNITLPAASGVFTTHYSFHNPVYCSMKC